jgi:Pectin methylesterase
MLELRVGKKNCDYYFIQEALNAVPYREKAIITIEEGVYEEKLFSDKQDLTLRGFGDVVITWSDGAREILPDGMKRGTFRTYTAFFSGERLRLENLTIVNDAGCGKEVGQAVALYLDADFAFIENVTLKSDQDTLFFSAASR